MRSKIITAAQRFDSAVRKTLTDEAIRVCDAITDEWEIMDRPTAREIARSIVAEYPRESQAARASEWTAFVLAAPCGLSTAIRYARQEMQSFTRVDLFRLCRILPDAANPKDAVAKLMDAKKKKPKRAKPQHTISDLMRTALKIQTRKQKEVAFRKELAALCNKYDIAH